MPDFLCKFVMAQVVVTIMVTLYPGIFFNLSLITILFRKCIQQNNLPVWYEVQVSHPTAVVKVIFGGKKGFYICCIDLKLNSEMSKKKKKSTTNCRLSFCASQCERKGVFRFLWLAHDQSSAFGQFLLHCLIQMCLSDLGFCQIWLHLTLSDKTCQSLISCKWQDMILSRWLS